MSTQPPNKYDARSSPHRERMLSSVAFALLCAFAFSIPLENSFVLQGVGTIGRMIGFVALGMGLLAVLDSGRLRSLTPIHLLMVAFVGWASLTYFWSSAPQETIQTVLTYTQLLALVWLIWQLAPQPRRQALLMQAYVLGTGVYAVGTILQKINASTLTVQRYAAFSINPNDAALRLVLSVPLALYLAATERNILRAWMFRLTVVAVVGATLLTASRGALLALIAGLLMIPLSIAKWTLKQKVATIAVMVITAFTVIALVPESGWQRIGRTGAEITQGTMNERTVIWRAGEDVFMDHPFAGVGAGAFAASVQRKLAYAWVAHNTFISVLVEQGVIGFGIFFLLLLIMLNATLRMPALERSLWIVMLLSWGVGVSAMTWEASKPTWFLFGLLSADISVLNFSPSRIFLKQRIAFSSAALRTSPRQYATPREPRYSNSAVRAHWGFPQAGRTNRPN
jgi:O-antigen ligase